MFKRSKVRFSLSLKELHSEQSVHTPGLFYRYSSAQARQATEPVPTVMDSGRAQVTAILI